MSSNRSSILPIFVFGLFIVSFTVPVLAEDIEIYTGDLSQSNVRPNVLFVMDTSGSMSGQVTITVTEAGSGPYDPTFTYTGSCDSTKIFWNKRGRPPSNCTNDDYFLVANNFCADSYTALNTGSGYYVGTLARFKTKSNNKGQWKKFKSGKHTHDVECKADRGVHGNGGSNLYAADQKKGGPWTSNSSKQISWSSVGKTYTLYTANYLNWLLAGGSGGSTTTTTMTRLEVVQNVFSNLMDSTSGINASVMRFDKNNSNGGYFLSPMQQLDNTTRQSFKDIVNALSPSGATPLAETLYESALFYRGDSVDYGDSSTPATNHVGVLKSGNTSVYKTPIEYQCQKNFTVVLTDGEPTYDTGADTKIKAMRGGTACSGNCLDEVAEFLYDNDQSSLSGNQNVTTYTIGFATDQTLLSDTAQKGGGKYYTADDIAGLSSAFTQILTEILEVNDSFTAPAVSVNAFNRLAHRNDLYFSLFRPALNPKWSGNVKRYILAGDPAVISDSLGTSAINQNTGFFDTNSRSYWTLDADAPDGDDIATGGAAGLLDNPGARVVYTYTGATAPSNVLLSASAHRLIETNTALTKGLMGISAETDAYRTDLVQWSRGVDIKDDDEDSSTSDGRRQFGDPLHSKPVLVTYGGTDESPDITLFVGTNEGYLHAINAMTGAELFSFVPKELLSNLNNFYVNNGTDHPYGLDGAITSWVKDVDGDNLIEPADGDHVYLYIGMRRGGDNYYALDVTTRTAPRLMWMVSGGTGDFAELGQSWSKPVLGKIKLNNVDKDVLIFTGGYDLVQDDATIYEIDNIGRAIYIVDATTGARLWWAGTPLSGADLEVTGMDNSFPASVQALDMNIDGYTDRLYTIDIHGKVFRFDLDLANSGASDLAAAGIIAEFGGTIEAENRRFYYQVDVAVTKPPGKPQYISLNVGSGFRAHPLNGKVQDEFYSFRDPYVYTVPTTYTSIDTTNLYDATANVIGTGTDDEIAAAVSTLLNDKKGWKISLKKSDGTWEGEKVQASALTFKGKVIFSTFSPVAASQVDSCAASQGTAKTYIVSLFDATPIKEDGVRFEILKKSGISPEAVVIFPTDDNGDATEPRIFIGQEDITGIGDLDKEIRPTNWIQTK